jgi:hypothetical protein
MAESALLWWLMDEEQYIHIIDKLSLMEFQREFESFLRLRYVARFPQCVFVTSCAGTSAQTPMQAAAPQQSTFAGAEICCSLKRAKATTTARRG